MSTVLFMSNQRMMVLEGSFSRDRIAVNKIIEHDLPEGSLINGVIINETDVLESLKQLWENHRLSRGKLQIVIDSTQFQLKNAQLPKLRDAAMQALVKNEFSGNERYNEPIFDYMVLRDTPSNPKMQDILCCGVERSFIHSYVELFRQAKLQVRSIDTALGGILKLISFQAQNGIFDLTAVSSQVNNIPAFIQRVKESGLFESVTYTGYGANQDAYSIFFQCVLRSNAGKEVLE